MSHANLDDYEVFPRTLGQESLDPVDDWPAQANKFLRSRRWPSPTLEAGSGPSGKKP